jgi:hypothetical protein
LVINGGQGSAKSTLAQVARKIVDPNAVPLLGRPNSERDLIAIAKGNHILAFDNLSGVNAAFADEICRLATGGGLGGRQLYTDADLAMFDAQRPVILNGIPDLANRGDLADRSICLSLPTIPPSQRKLEKAMWSRFETALPVIFAGLLDAMVEGLRRWEMLEARADAGEIELPRMADFALWGMAVAPAFGWTEDDFLAAYARNRSDSEQHVVEASALAESLIDLLKVRGEFTGTATQLLIEIRKRHPSAVFRQALPKSPQSVGTELRRLEPALATMGIEMELGVREGGTGRRINHIRQVD